MSSRRWFVAIAVALVLVFAVLAAGEIQGRRVADGPTPVAALLFDCSGFRRLTDRYDFVAEMVQLARAVAAANQVLRYACVDGRPDTTLAFQTRDFSTPLGGDPHQPQDGERIKARNEAWAAELQGPFQDMIATGRVWKWSGLLEGLSFPARDPDVKTIWFWTDGEIRDPETRFSLPHASDAEIQQQIASWAPRLRGLHGKTLIVVGGGLGAEDQDTAQKAEAFFRTLVEQEIGGKLYWTRTLGEVDPTALLR